MLQAVRACCEALGTDKTYWIAFSGGLDSHVLLSLCAALRTEHSLSLRAIHLNHRVSPFADEWAAHCARVCAALNIDYVEATLAPASSVVNLEESLRQQRYAVFAQHIHANDVLLTAHHQDDQAETLLVQLLRGAGPKGLAAMPRIKSFAKGTHARPLLDVPRTALQQYAETQGLRWIDDESNANQAFTRNFLRHDILPRLGARWPTVQATLSRSASHCAEAQVLLESFAATACEQTKGSVEGTLSVARLNEYNPAQQRLILRTWIEQRGFPLPDTRKLETIQQTVLTAAWDRLPTVRWQGTALRRYRDDLYLMLPMPAHHPDQTYAWDLQTPLCLNGIGQLYASPVKEGGLTPALQTVTVRFRQGGEILHLDKRGRHTLKNLFHEWNVLPWLRDRLPLIFSGDRLVCVPGYFVDKDYEAVGGEGRAILFL